MPKKKSVSLPTATPGQPSAALLAALKAAGAKVTVARVAEALGHLDSARARFTCEAIGTGLLLLAKKETLQHGELMPFAAAVWAAMQKGKVEARASTLEGEALNNFTKSLRVYALLARHFLADLEQAAFERDGKDQAVTLPAVQPAEVLALDTLPDDQRTAVVGAIERFVGGRSLRRMLVDFRRAESAAEQEEIEEANRRRKKKKGEDSGQLDFWTEIQRPLTEIETLCDSPEAMKHATKGFWTNLAVALETQAKRARARAKEVAA